MAPAQRLVSRDGTLFDLDLFTFTIGVNLIGMFDVIRNVAGVMAGNEPDGNGERGVIVNVASWEPPRTSLTWCGPWGRTPCSTVR